MKNEPGEWGRGNNGRKETVGGERTAWTAPASVLTSPKLKGIKTKLIPFSGPSVSLWPPADGPIIPTQSPSLYDSKTSLPGNESSQAQRGARKESRPVRKPITEKRQNLNKGQFGMLRFLMTQGTWHWVGLGKHLGSNAPYF